MKLNADKYKNEVGKLKKSLKAKDKDLAKSANNLKKAEDDHATIRAQVQKLLA